MQWYLATIQQTSYTHSYVHHLDIWTYFLPFFFLAVPRQTKNICCRDSIGYGQDFRFDSVKLINWPMAISQMFPNQIPYKRTIGKDRHAKILHWLSQTNGPRQMRIFFFRANSVNILHKNVNAYVSFNVFTVHVPFCVHWTLNWIVLCIFQMQNFVRFFSAKPNANGILCQMRANMK